MFWVPYGKIQIKSNLCREEIELRIREQLEPTQIISGFLRGKHKYFEGELKNGQFKISRIVTRNSFTPLIIGEIQQEIDHVIIDITVQLKFVVLVLLLFILFGFPCSFIQDGISFLLHVSDLLITGENFFEYMSRHFYLWLSILFFVVFFLVFYLFIIAVFNYETEKVLKHLTELTAGQRSSRS